MQFTKVGRCPSPIAGRSGERIWLALKNNTRWPVLVRANGVEDECYGEASPFYRVGADGPMVPDGPIPYGHWFDVASLLEFAPGEVLNFSVPKAHLDPGLSIRVDFQFNWEENNRYTRYSSNFSYWDLPRAIQNKEKEKTLKCVSGPCIIAVPKATPIKFPMPSALTPDHKKSGKR
jgi:hypothetical protein